MQNGGPKALDAAAPASALTATAAKIVVIVVLGWEGLQRMALRAIEHAAWSSSEICLHRLDGKSCYHNHDASHDGWDLSHPWMC